MNKEVIKKIEETKQFIKNAEQKQSLVKEKIIQLNAKKDEYIKLKGEREKELKQYNLNLSNVSSYLNDEMDKINKLENEIRNILFNDTSNCVNTSSNEINSDISF